jgi:pilus assembly protein Flp/PilA
VGDATRVRILFDEEWGASAVEYGILIGAIAALIIAIAFLIGGEVADYFQGFYDTFIASKG